MITVSVVSHGQSALVRNLLDDIRDYCPATPLQVILTLNIEEILPFELAEFPFEIRIIKNRQRQGFAANHNAAFVQAHGEYFAVLNPDIRFKQNPFPVLIAALNEAAVAGPMVVGSEGQVEDSARRFPTPLRILRKFFFGSQGPDYVISSDTVQPDWIAGMFMLWRSDIFRLLGGFDEGFFLYYEDVDACARLRQAGFNVVLDPSAKIVHYAQRASHRNFRYLRWHLASMLRFFGKQIVGKYGAKLKY